jgi:trehalose-6-phosphate synthase
MPEKLWNENSLCDLVRSRLGDRLFLVVSNREPYVHTLSRGALDWSRPVGGLTEALDPVMRASGGTWIAQGTGEGDRRAVDSHDRVAVPPDDPKYTLRRVWLTGEQNSGFYLGFSNSALWPLFHIAFTPPVFREADWRMYQQVNTIFAGAAIEEIGDRPALVLLQDYHFALLSRYLKGKNPRLTLGQFWHIPWPPYDVFRTCPWAEEIIRGMLGNDLIGFQTASFCRNFLDCAARFGLTVDNDKSTVSCDGNTTVVWLFPISVDFAAINSQAASDAVTKEMDSLVREYNLEGKIIGLGTDRLDYTKGIPERLLSLDKFLADCPEYVGKVVFIQSGMPSRTQIDAYCDVSRRVEELTNIINSKYGSASYRPVISLDRQLSAVTLIALRRLAWFVVVSSLQDGMNLVGKEFAAARPDEDGVLILSKFAGAAEELPDALLVNPFDVADFSRKIRQAVEMPAAERRMRMKNMRDVVAARNIYRWAADVVTSLAGIADT